MKLLIHNNNFVLIIKHVVAIDLTDNVITYHTLIPNKNGIFKDVYKLPEEAQKQFDLIVEYLKKT